MPALGGRIWELEDRLRGRQWIWHRGPANLQSQPVGAKYDEVWAGGWEELFPNDAAGVFEGRVLPDHGEWWASPWTVTELDCGAEPRLKMTARMNVVRAACTKLITLPADGETLSIQYGILSEEREPFHFLFKQHLPIRLTPQCRIQLPGGIVRAVDPSFGTLLSDDTEFTWPHARGRQGVVDMRHVPAPSDAHREFVYVRRLPDAWCGVDDLAGRASLRMYFSALELPYVWLFLTYGGWRGHYTAVLEPCSNYPKDLARAVQLGRSARLDPGQEFRTQISVTLTPLLPNGKLASHNMRESSGSSGAAK